MLNVCTYQVVLLRSHSGTCWTSAIRTSSSSGSNSTAAIRKTPVVWYDLLPGVRTTKNCASATAMPRMMNVGQPGVFRFSCVR